MTEKIDLYSMTDTELEEFFISLGEPKFRAKQVFPRLHAGERIEEIPNLSKPLREKLKEITSSATEALAAATTEADVENVKNKTIGRNGSLTALAPMMGKIAALRDKYKLRLRVERYISEK